MENEDSHKLRAESREPRAESQELRPTTYDPRPKDKDPKMKTPSGFWDRKFMSHFAASPEKTREKFNHLSVCKVIINHQNESEIANNYIKL